MTSDAMFAAAAHLYVVLRRKSGRIIDTIWMVHNADYAAEVLRIARAQSDGELVKLADRFEALMFGEPAAAGAVAPSSSASATSSAAKYIGSLR